MAQIKFAVDKDNQDIQNSSGIDQLHVICHSINDIF